MKSVIVISLIGIIVGFLFTVLAFGFDLARAIKGVVAGFLITFIIGLFEYFVFQNKFKKLKFSSGLLIRTLVYVAVISFAVISVWVIHESSLNDVNIFTTLMSSDFRYFIFKGDFKIILLFAVIVGFLINLFTQINNLLGKKVLLNYITGKYHKPKEEERAFMFLDLSSSTTIAEKLGPVVYHKFINSYFFDIDSAIVESGGEIYQYVGDEVVISWKDDKGYENANCIKCFFKIRDKIDSLSEFYKKEFGIVPGFKAGLHGGPVITGEIGDSKKEIVFTGDVLNTASRIQTQCNALGKKFLVSVDVLNKVKLPSEYKSESLGVFTLRGKAREIEIYNLFKEKTA
ncbi:MAG: adenylate/guanylate cyclase domain-containing protein [Bacteroidota bacterium]|nr:adenylate/guanylate cyclase domain-containing protein [Bacteroidota bacterium]